MQIYAWRHLATFRADFSYIPLKIVGNTERVRVCVCVCARVCMREREGLRANL